MIPLHAEVFYIHKIMLKRPSVPNGTDGLFTKDNASLSVTSRNVLPRTR